MCRLVETIRSENGILNNLEFHNERMMRTLSDLFGLNKVIDLGRIIFVPGHALNGIFKCRVEYDHEIRKTEFIRYSLKKISTLKAVEDNTIEYNYKFTDRNVIEKLLKKREECDDILIIKNGFITDTSYANVVLRDKYGVWYTPSTYLLPGTRRAFLLRQGKIIETKIGFRDLENYTEIKLINAMLDIEDTEGISVRKIT
jgi:4-amino-4-deoxychorismate lyase